MSHFITCCWIYEFSYFHCFDHGQMIIVESHGIIWNGGWNWGWDPCTAFFCYRNWSQKRANFAQISWNLHKGCTFSWRKSYRRDVHGHFLSGNNPQYLKKHGINEKINIRFLQRIIFFVVLWILDGFGATFVQTKFFSSPVLINVSLKQKFWCMRHLPTERHMSFTCVTKLYPSTIWLKSEAI